MMKPPGHGREIEKSVQIHENKWKWREHVDRPEWTEQNVFNWISFNPLSVPKKIDDLKTKSRCRSFVLYFEL